MRAWNISRHRAKFSEITLIKSLVGYGLVEHHGDVGTQTIGEFQLPIKLYLVLCVEGKLTRCHRWVLLAVGEVAIGILCGVIGHKVVERGVGVCTSGVGKVEVVGTIYLV